MDRQKEITGKKEIAGQKAELRVGGKPPSPLGKLLESGEISGKDASRIVIKALCTEIVERVEGEKGCPAHLTSVVPLSVCMRMHRACKDMLARLEGPEEEGEEEFRKALGKLFSEEGMQMLAGILQGEGVLPIEQRMNGKVEIEDRIGGRELVGENAGFYSKSGSLAGMEEGRWPPLLRVALEQEEAWLEQILGKREIMSGQKFVDSDVFLEIGCGTGRTLPKRYSRFGQVIGVDFSEPMLDAAKESLDQMGWDGNRVRLIRGEVVEMSFIASESVGVAACLFNAFGGMNTADRTGMLLHTGRSLKPHVSIESYPPGHLEGTDGTGVKPPSLLFMTAYRNNGRTVETQGEFYERMGLRGIEARKLHTIAVTEEGDLLKSRRFSERGLRGILRKARREIEGETRQPGLVIVSIFPISEIMMGVLLAPAKEFFGASRSDAKIRNELLGKMELGDEIERSRELWGPLE